VLWLLLKKIIAAAIEHNVDIIGLSGLITPSLMKWFIWLELIKEI
jgi:cobalamin-dependent methionine synthase I